MTEVARLGIEIENYAGNLYYVTGISLREVIGGEFNCSVGIFQKREYKVEIPETYEELIKPRIKRVSLRPRELALSTHSRSKEYVFKVDKQYFLPEKQKISFDILFKREEIGEINRKIKKLMENEFQLGGLRKYGMGVSRVDSYKIFNLENLDFPEGEKIKLISPLIGEPFSGNRLRKREVNIHGHPHMAIDHGQEIKPSKKKSGLEGIKKVGERRKLGYGEFVVK